MLWATWDVLVALAPWLFLGAALAGVLHVLLPDDFVRRHLTGRGAVLKSVVLGVPLPLCSCGVIPTGLGLRKNGASEGASVGFLISTPQTGVDSVLVSAAFLGWPFALFKLGAAAVTGLLGGWLTDAGEPARQTHLPPRMDACGAKNTSGDACGATTTDRSVAGGARHAVDLLRTIWRWLAVGVLASAAITVFVPQTWLAGLSGHGVWLALLAALLVSLPLYVCATASVPIAAALVAGGFPPGAALVFLMAGPATNVATLGAIWRALGRRAFVVYLTTIVVGSLLLGWAFDFVLPSAGQAAVAQGHAEGAWWATLSAAALVGMLAWFAVEDLRQWVRRRSASKLAARSPRTQSHSEPSSGSCCGSGSQ